MATIKNAIDTTLQATSPRLTVTGIAIGSTGNSFLKAKNISAIMPSSILLTATPTGMTSPTYQWYYATSTAPDTFISIGGASSSTYTVTSANFITHKGTGTSVSYKCIATQTGWATAESLSIITYTSQSNDVPVAILTNSSCVLPTTSGGVTTFTGSGTDIRVSIGGTFLPWAASGANSFSVAASPITNIGSGTVGTMPTTSTVTSGLPGSVAGDTLRIADFNTMSADSASVTYTISARDCDGVVTTITRVQTFAKSTAGSPGTAGSTIDISLTTSTVLAASAAGVVSVFTGSGNTIKFKNGTTDFNFATSGTAINTFTVSTVAVNVTAGSWSGSGTTTATISNITAFTANTIGTITYTITAYLAAGVPTVYTRVQTFTQAIGGVAGDVAVTAYRLFYSAGLPTSNTGTSSTTVVGVASGAPTAGVVSQNTGNTDTVWYTQPPTGTITAGYWLFQSSGTKTAAGVYTWQSSSFLASFKVGKLDALSAEVGNLVITAPTAGSAGGSIRSGKTSSVDTANAGFYLGNSTITAGSFVVGSIYTIVTAGTTNFTLIGAANSTPGTVFTATGVGTGTGTAATAPSFKIGNAGDTYSFTWNGTSLSLAGNIVGSSSIDITGSANFKGSTTVGILFTTAISGNTSLGANVGAYGVSNNTRATNPRASGVHGHNSASTGVAVGVYGLTSSSTGYGIYGMAAISGGNGVMGVAGGTSGTTGVGGRFINGTQLNEEITTVKSQVELATTSYAIDLSPAGTVGGIHFPATPILNANPNTLDDYEEGTFSPTLTATSGSFTYTAQVATYTKIGNRVFVSGVVIVNTATSPTGTLYISALPFTSTNTTNMYAPAAIYATGITRASPPVGTIQGLVMTNDTKILLRDLNNGTLSELATTIVAGVSICFEAQYTTAS